VGIAKKPVANVPKPGPAEVAQITSRLSTAIPSPPCELDHKDPWTLLVATILSAQSTDRLVNTVTPVLFDKWPTPQALAAAPREEVEAVVHRTGFFRNKAKAIQGASLAIHEQFGGQVPREMQKLLTLPGVARKTANVVLGVAFRVAEGVVVDTHVMRVAQRLGLSQATTADKVEQELCQTLPREQWIDMGHRFLLHGRYVCVAKGPDCENCPINEQCASRVVPPLGPWEQRAKHLGDLVASRGAGGDAAKPGAR